MKKIFFDLLPWAVFAWIVIGFALAINYFVSAAFTLTDLI